LLASPGFSVEDFDDSVDGEEWDILLNLFVDKVNACLGE
jgi:hypothetical protein